MRYLMKLICLSLLFLVACDEKRSIPKVDNLAPEYNLFDPEGQQVTSQKSIGRVRLVVFWATWCKPCVEEVPVLNDIQARYKQKDLDIHAISVDRISDQSKIPLFMKKYSIRYPVLVGSPSLQTKFRSNKVPTTYLLNQKGEYVRKWNGPQPAHVFMREIDKLLLKAPES